MPTVAAASPLKPIATRTPLIAITAVHALCRTIKARLVTLTSQDRLLTGSGKAAAEFSSLLVEETISFTKL